MTRADNSNRLRNRAAAMELTPDRFREIGHELVDRLADHLAGLRSGRVTPGETPQQVRAAIGTSPAPRRGNRPCLGRPQCGGVAAEALAVQWASTIPGLRHVEPHADRSVRRPHCRCCESECRGMDTLSRGHRDRGSDDPLDRRVYRLSRGLWRPAGQRREHGQSRRIPCRTRRERWRGDTECGRDRR